MSKYITIRRIHDKVIGGEVNLPYGTNCDVDSGGYIYTIINEKKIRICAEYSERAYKDFAYNVDGRGEERKDIINDCIERMSRIHHREDFVRFLYDWTAMKYKKHPEDDTEWSWDRAKVHKAPIEDLEHIRDIIRCMKIQ